MHSLDELNLIEFTLAFAPFSNLSFASWIMFQTLNGTIHPIFIVVKKKFVTQDKEQSTKMIVSIFFEKQSKANENALISHCINANQMNPNQKIDQLLAIR